MAWLRSLLQGSAGAAATLQRLTNETGLTVQQIQANVKAKKGQVCASDSAVSRIMHVVVF